MKRKHVRAIRRLRKDVALLRRKMRAAYGALEDLDQRTRPREDVIGFRHEE